MKFPVIWGFFLAIPLLQLGGHKVSWFHFCIWALAAYVIVSSLWVHAYVNNGVQPPKSDV